MPNNSTSFEKGAVANSQKTNLGSTSHFIIGGLTIQQVSIVIPLHTKIRFNTLYISMNQYYSVKPELFLAKWNILH